MLTNHLETQPVQKSKLIPHSYPCDLDESDVEQLLPHRGDIFFARHIRLLAEDHYLGFISWEETAMGIAGHFPAMPIIPAVYLIEAAAQVAGAGMIAAQSGSGDGATEKLGVLAGVRRCAFMKPVLPGQQVVFDLTARRASGNFVFVKGNATVDGIRVATFDLAVAFAPRSQLFTVN